MTILRPEAFFLLVPALLAVAVSVRCETRAHLWRERFSSSRPSDGESDSSSARSRFPGRFRSAVLAFSLLCAVCALARPVWNPHSDEAEESGQDALFLVDVSRSMNTADVSASLGSGESRLDAVKNALTDLVPTLSGDRTALVAFAGTSVPKCPLTTDRVFFSNAVRLLDAGSTSRGGTLLGDSLRMVKKNFVPSSKNLAVWVFTDGGDQESFPVEAAQALADSGVRLYIWGVGSTEGAEVPERGVVSALDEALLGQVAAAVPEGEYFGSNIPLWRLASEYSARRKPTSATTSSYTFWDEGSWFLLWPIFFLLLSLPLLRAVSVFGSRLSRGGSGGGNTGGRAFGSDGGSPRSRKKGKILSGSIVLVAALLSSSCSAPADSPRLQAPGAQSAAASGIWQSPADEAALKQLSARTLEKGLSRSKRAQLFYLYGQESVATGNTEAAIASFERVVDLGSLLADESRINLEILYRRREHEQQNAEQSSADQQQKKQDGDQKDANGADQQQKDAEQSSGEQSSGDQKDADGADQQKKQDGDQKDANGADQQQNADGDQQDAEQSSAEQSSAEQKDMSGLVREKEGNSALEQALRAEAERMSQKQQQEAGNAVPVEKDW